MNKLKNDSDFSVRYNTYQALGGVEPAKKFDSVYSVDLEILKLTEQGGGGGGAKIDDENISSETVWSSQKTKEEIDNAGGGGLSDPFYTEHIEAEGEWTKELYNMGIKNDTYGIKLQQSRLTPDGETFDDPIYQLVIDGSPTYSTDVVVNRNGLSWVTQANGQTFTNYSSSGLIIKNRVNPSESTGMFSNLIWVPRG